MKAIRSIILLSAVLYFGGCSKDNDQQLPIYEPGFTVVIQGSASDSANGRLLKNAVVWVKQTYGNSTLQHTVTNDLGNFTITLGANPNFPESYTLFISKGGYDLKTMTLLTDTSRIRLDIPLVRSARDTMNPFCIGWSETANNSSGMDEVTIYFSEEVNFDVAHMEELAQIIFKRSFDICSTTANAFTYEHQSDICYTDATSVRFIHRLSDSGSCYNEFMQESYTKTAYWSLFSIQLLPYLCNDISGNYLEEFIWLGK